MSLCLVVSGSVILAGNVEPDFDLFFSLTLPGIGSVHCDCEIHALIRANDRPKVRGNRDLRHVLCALDDLVANLHVGRPIGFLAAVVL